METRPEVDADHIATGGTEGRGYDIPVSVRAFAGDSTMTSRFFLLPFVANVHLVCGPRLADSYVNHAPHIADHTLQFQHGERAAHCIDGEAAASTHLVNMYRFA